MPNKSLLRAATSAKQLPNRGRGWEGRFPEVKIQLHQFQKTPSYSTFKNKASTDRQKNKYNSSTSEILHFQFLFTDTKIFLSTW